LAEQEVPGTGDDMETTLAIVGQFGRYAAGALEARAKRARREAKRMVAVADPTDHGAAPESVIAKGCKGLSSLRAIRQDEDESRDPRNGADGHVTCSFTVLLLGTDEKANPS
jgi:hypothetical protein